MMRAGLCRIPDKSRVMLLPLMVVVSMIMSFFPLEVSAADRGSWAAYVSYAVNDNVTYDGKSYKAIQSHTSLPGWEPPNVPALWQHVQGGGGNDTAAPTAPANVTVRSVTSSSVTLSWQASTDNVGVTGYDVYQGTALAASVTGTSATIAGLSPNTTYSFKVIAKDAAGNLSPASASVTATTAEETGGGPQPTKHILTGYWQNFVNGASKLKVRDIPDQYDIIVLAFAEMDPVNPGGVVFNVDSALSAALGGYTNAELIADIQTKRAQGKKVIISIGGELGNIDLNTASPNITNFVNSMYGIITQFGLDGIDIDLEHGMNVPNLTTAIRQLKQKAGNDFILTMAPQTIDMQSPNTSYMQLYNNLKDITTVMNVQYYNSGCMLGRDGKCYSQGTVDFLTALSDLTLQWVSPSQLGLGVPAASSAAGGGYVSPTVVNNALNCLATGNNCGSYKPVAKYPDVRGAMTWSINWDATTNYALAKTVRPFLDTLP
ncbi:glycosyl hydrolase family 18 protein [Paenibacillus sp. FSL K6-1566]|uniref:chitinase n=1 Tax=unclassified Paenibacillus TaxID=185978 RepID=UPI0030F633DF